MIGTKRLWPCGSAFIWLDVQRTPSRVWAKQKAQIMTVPRLHTNGATRTCKQMCTVWSLISIMMETTRRRLGVSRRRVEIPCYQGVPEFGWSSQVWLAVPNYLIQLDPQLAFSVRQRKPKTIVEAVTTTLEMESYHLALSKTVARNIQQLRARRAILHWCITVQTWHVHGHDAVTPHSYRSSEQYCK